MKLLLDTHAFIWWVEAAPQLTRQAKEYVADGNNEVYLSLASSWEMAIKSSMGKLKLSVPLREYVPQHLAANGFKQLPMTFRQISVLESLELHHRDPFDRLLIAQAMTENLAIVSADRTFDDYKVQRIW
jgi:PIN domain nuclease of toxin-antitoxin system